MTDHSPDQPAKDPLRAVYVISVAAELAGVHAQTLRIYERKGLVAPARTPGGSRRYSDIDINRLLRIQQLTNDGLNLAGVKRVMDLEAEIERLQAELVDLHERANAAIASARREHRRDLVPLEQSVVRWERRSGG